MLFAVGGTGGHLFPAQALATELLDIDPAFEIQFVGAHLDTNRFLDKERFGFAQVASATPFVGNPLRATWTILRGIGESICLLWKQKPALVVGFGSYHCFTLIAAAKLLGIPYVLFEADAIAGKVNRLFSRYALFTAIHFAKARIHLKGKTVLVAMPTRHQATFTLLTQEQARLKLGLDAHCFTLLVFGGSQGARGLNQSIFALLGLLKNFARPIQLIHLTGDIKTSEWLRERCAQLGIRCYIAEFEQQMGYLWRASTMVIARAGASTLNEMILFETPGILIPFPHGSQAHQHANAEVLEKQIKAGFSLLEEQATAEALFAKLSACAEQIESFQESIRAYKLTEKKETLARVIYGYYQ